MAIIDNLTRLRSEIPRHVKIIAVSKTMPVHVIKEAYEAGLRAFGENRVQEMTDKEKLLPGDVEWHLVGHLQTNKVKLIVPYVSLIQSVDSLRLLSEINREAVRINRRIDVLLQMRIAREETKFGLHFSDAVHILNSGEFGDMQHVRITGLMGMATFTENTTQIKDEFRQLSGYFNEIKTRWFSDDHGFREISMGMSGDYMLAIEAGSTMVRIGTLIFGERNYH